MSGRRSGRRSAVTTAALAALALVGCDNVEWGGIDFEVREPAAEVRAGADTAGADTAAARAAALALPEGPVLFHVRRLDPAGRARIQPVAAVTDTGFVALRPRRPDLGEEYAERFSARYYAGDASFSLYRGGARVGSLVIEGALDADGGPCPALPADGRLELRPRADTMTEFLAWTIGVRAARDTLELPRSRADMRELAPILVDRLLRERGIRGNWVIRSPAEIRAVRVGEGEFGFAATFVVGDSLGVGSPPDSAGSALVVADHAAARGYFPQYFDATWYGPGQKRVVRWLDRIQLVDDAAQEWVLQAFGDSGVWYEIVGRAAGERRQIWTGRDPVCEARQAGRIAAH